MSTQEFIGDGPDLEGRATRGTEAGGKARDFRAKRENATLTGSKEVRNFCDFRIKFRTLSTPSVSGTVPEELIDNAAT